LEDWSQEDRILLAAVLAADTARRRPVAGAGFELETPPSSTTAPMFETLLGRWAYALLNVLRKDGVESLSPGWDSFVGRLGSGV